MAIGGVSSPTVQSSVSQPAAQPAATESTGSKFLDAVQNDGADGLNGGGKGGIGGDTWNFGDADIFEASSPAAPVAIDPLDF